MKTLLALFLLTFSLHAQDDFDPFTAEVPVAAGGGELLAVTAYGSGSDFHGYQWMGFSFTNGASQITVTAMGRVRATGNSETHKVAIFNYDPATSNLTNAPGNTMVGEVSVDMSAGSVGETNFAACSLVLAANQIYIIAATEIGSDANQTSTITTTADIFKRRDAFVNGTDWATLNGPGTTLSRVQFKYTVP